MMLPVPRPAAPPCSPDHRRESRALSRLTRSVLAALAAAVSLAGSLPAAAQASLAGGERVPLEQRVALSLGPSLSTLWTQLRVRTKPGALAVVVAAAPGASLDWSTPAWFEALELATAPRVLPPASAVGTCPGEPAEEVVDVVGQTFHDNPLSPLDVAVLADADAVALWAAERGLAVPPSLHTAMATLGAGRFVAARFEAPDGEALTPTLRVVGPGLTPVLPLVLTEATSAPLLVTVWTLGPGRAALDGPAESIVGGELTFDAATGQSDYADAREAALLGSAGAWMLEATSRVALVGGLDFGATPQHIDGALHAYFERAALYQSGAIDAPSCIAAATAAMGSAASVADACPRAALGWVDSGTPCSEVPAPGQVDPALLRCGALADDLAVAMSGQQADAAWLSRHALLIDAGSFGVSHAVASTPGAAQDPVWTAGALDDSGCAGAGGGSSSGSASSSGGPSSSGSGSSEVQVPVYEVDTSCGAHEVGEILYYIAVEASDTETVPDYYYQERDGCSADTANTVAPVYSESSAAVDGYGYGSDGSNGYQGDDCSGDSSTAGDSSSDCSGDSSGSSSSSDCSGDSSGSSSSSDCGGDSGGSSSGSDCGGDSGGSSSDCTFSHRRGRRLPPLSIIITALAALLAPLRRLGRRRRRRRRGRARR